MSISKKWSRGKFGNIVDDSGNTVLITGVAMPCGPRNIEAERNTEDMLTAVLYHDRLVGALTMFVESSAQTMLPVECERAEALLAELSAHNGGEG